MKNRRPIKNREILLLYRFRDTEIGRQLHGVAARMGILCRVVEKDQTEEILGALLKLPGYALTGPSALAASNASAASDVLAASDASAVSESSKMDAPETGKMEPPARQAMIMYGFTNRRLDELLSNMKRAGLPRIPLKAIVTPQNIEWTFRMLYEELEKEEAAMRSGNQQTK
ncbi:MAG: DUF3783 domain-containing protein [Lachnospiraceae bacterium]|nr:DUF3783 domain-containing protein [Lachnospiraceae bacterium]